MTIVVATRSSSTTCYGKFPVNGQVLSEHMTYCCGLQPLAAVSLGIVSSQHISLDAGWRFPMACHTLAVS
jgi:hypothetical protein